MTYVKGLVLSSSPSSSISKQSQVLLLCMQPATLPAAGPSQMCMVTPGSCLLIKHVPNTSVPQWGSWVRSWHSLSRDLPHSPNCHSSLSPPIITWVLGMQILVLTLSWQAFYALSHLPSPSHHFVRELSWTHNDGRCLSQAQGVIHTEFSRCVCCH